MLSLKEVFPVALAFGFLLLPCAHANAQEQGDRSVRLSFSDGRSDAVGLVVVNEQLRKVGVRISEVPVPEAAWPVVEISKARSLGETEKQELLKIFSLDREALLEEVEKAGRQPAVEGGAALLMVRTATKR